jgi:hypothetical protein
MWAMCGRVSDLPFAARAAATASSDSRTARSPIAWKWGWSPAASIRVDEADPAPGAGPAVHLEIRIQHRAGERLEDAVGHQLHAVRPVPARRAAPGPFDQLLDLFEPAYPIPPERALDPAGQPAALGCPPVRRVAGRLDDRVLPGRDPERVEDPLR